MHHDEKDHTHLSVPERESTRDRASTPECGRTMTRRSWLGVAAGGAVGAVLLDGCVYELRRVTVTRHRRDPLPGQHTRFLTAQVSDLHLKAIGAREETVLQVLHEERPALTVLTGDIIDRVESLPVLERFLAEMPAHGEKIAIIGNWERWCRVDLEVLRSTYERHGCRLLLNERVRIDAGGARLDVVGVDNSVNGKPDLEAALDGGSTDDSRLFLAHCPVQRDDIAAELKRLGSSAEGLVLAGHTHGGQVTILGYAPALPRESGRYVAGWYGGSELDLYVSRGLGTSSFPIRIGAPPEVALFEWSV